MFPALWPNGNEGILIRNLHLTSLGLYVRQAPATDDEPTPPAYVGNLSRIGFDREGRETIADIGPSGRRIHGDVHKIDDDQARLAITDRWPNPDILAVREYAAKRKPLVSHPIPYQFGSLQIVQAADLCAVSTSSQNNEPATFIRYSDGQQWQAARIGEANFAFYGSPSQNQDAFTLWSNAKDGGLAYDRLIATRAACYALGYGSPLGQSFTGDDGEQPQALNIGLTGNVAARRPIAVLGPDLALAIVITLQSIPSPNENSFGGKRTEPINECRVYQVQLIGGAMVNAQLTASVTGQWVLRDGTGDGAGPNGEDVPPIYDAEMTGQGDVLTAAMMTAGGLVQSRIPWNASVAQMTAAPAGYMEVTPQLWLRKLRTFQQQGQTRFTWQYSRNQGGAWTSLPPELTDLAVEYAGQSSIAHDFRVSSGIRAAMEADEIQI